MGQWENVGECSKTCGGGQQTQQRKCNGNYCGSEQNIRLVPCRQEKCADVWSDWGEWDNCSVTCGGGQQKKERTMIEGQRKGKRETDRQSCNNHACPKPTPATRPRGDCEDKGAFTGEYWEKGCIVNTVIGIIPNAIGSLGSLGGSLGSLGSMFGRR